MLEKLVKVKNPIIEPSKPDDKDGNIKIGDFTNPIFYITVMTISIGYMIYAKRKNRRDL